MNKNLGLTFILIFSLFSWSENLYSQQIAFPGAEGYGKYTVGGRGGKVYEVTNLNDSGSGSLRAAVEASGPRTVVFLVSGTIILNSNLKISDPYITIAGQTAPGDGICVSTYPLVISTDEVIIRYIRVRFGDESGDDADAISSRYTKNIILDHVSASWSVDEVMSIYHCDSITVQWCLISESMYNSNHIKDNHGFGGIWGSNYSTYHHNLLAHHTSRNPRFASGCGYTDYRNNVIYNWGFNSCYGGEKVQQGSSTLVFTSINMVANYYKPGPASSDGIVSYRIANPSSRDKANDYGLWYIDANVIDGNDRVTADNWDGGVQPQDGSSYIEGLKLDKPWSSMAILQQTALDAYASVLDNAGATLSRRDTIDARVIDETRHGYASYGASYGANSGIIDSQLDVGGWPVLNSTAAPNDKDHDGMPDDWEILKGLDPNSADDRNNVTNDGYTNLEKYLNSIEFLNPVEGYQLAKLTDTSYLLQWRDNYLAEDGFLVERSYNDDKFELIDSLPMYSNSFVDNSVLPGKVTYRVIAYNAENMTQGGSGISSELTRSSLTLGEFENTEVQSFDPPGVEEEGNDWVLILESIQ